MASSEFQKKVWKICSRVPKGKVSTYGLIAKALECPDAARAVGQALGKNKKLIKIPCHRVIKSSGEIGGYAKGPKAKKKLLRSEGVMVRKGRVVNFNKIIYRF